MAQGSGDVEAEFQKAKTLVEDVIKKLGLDPTKLRGKATDDLATWTFTRGSAQVLVTVSKSERGDGAFLRAVSPIMTMPPADRLLAFYRRLLELNASGLVNAAFGIVDDQIVAASERPTVGLDASEVEQIVRHLSAVADTYDDRLVKEFGGKRASDV